MNILTINCGSSSLKLSLFEKGNEFFQRKLEADFKGLNSSKLMIKISSGDEHEVIELEGPFNVREAINILFEKLEKNYRFSFSEVKVIGHRFVHGGSYYEPLILTSPLIEELKKISYLAPLHNYACLEGIEACLHKCQLLGLSIPQIAVFDTAFHHNLPQVASRYALPPQNEDLKRYGFHGIANAYLWSVYHDKIRSREPKSKIITLHLGSGCSATAINEGKSLDTSMGFSPAEGLIMGTRAGDIDASVVEFLCRHDQKTPEEVLNYLNSFSGLLGISGISSNMEALLDLYDENEAAHLAIDMFCYRIVKYIGAYIAVLGGVDSLIFSGGIGENSPKIRELILTKLNFLGLRVDEKMNRQVKGSPFGTIHRISDSDSTIASYVIACDENRYIAEAAFRIIN